MGNDSSSLESSEESSKSESSSVSIIAKEYDDPKCVCYYQQGSRLLHNDNWPAIVYDDGSEEWYQHGQLHRDGGPARTIYTMKDGRLHKREEWYMYGRLYRCPTQGVPIIGFDEPLYWEGERDKYHKISITDTSSSSDTDSSSEHPSILDQVGPI